MTERSIKMYELTEEDIRKIPFQMQILEYDKLYGCINVKRAKKDRLHTKDSRYVYLLARWDAETIAAIIGEKKPKIPQLKLEEDDGRFPYEYPEEEPEDPYGV